MTCAICGNTSKRGTDRCSICRQAIREGKRPQAPISRRRAKGNGTCSRCGKSYKKGDKLAGSKGDWFHQEHLAVKEWTKINRIVGAKFRGRKVSGGGSETNRRRH